MRAGKAALTSSGWGGGRYLNYCSQLGSGPAPAAAARRKSPKRGPGGYASPNGGGVSHQSVHKFISEYNAPIGGGMSTSSGTITVFRVRAGLFPPTCARPLHREPQPGCQRSSGAQQPPEMAGGRLAGGGASQKVVSIVHYRDAEIKRFARGRHLGPMCFAASCGSVNESASFAP